MLGTITAFLSPCGKPLRVEPRDRRQAGTQWYPFPDFPEMTAKDLVLQPDWANACVIESFDECNLWQLPQVSRKANKTHWPICSYLALRTHYVNTCLTVMRNLNLVILIKPLGRHTWTLVHQPRWQTQVIMGVYWDPFMWRDHGLVWVAETWASTRK